ncbi:MAG: DUF371 domain-containing protein [Candidatus Heimdallarchaeaceae archaeon]
MIEVSFECKGHPNIRATHKTTLEITKDECVSLRGDCIIGVKSTLSIRQLPKEMKEIIKNEKSEIRVLLKTNDHCETIIGKGNPKLELSDDRCLIIRKSNFVCPKTLMVNANKAAKDLSRDFIEELMKPTTVLYIKIQAVLSSMENSKQT